jgi:hypothetical protein
MAENVAITPGSGDVVGADDISGVKYQRVKLIHGADGVNAGDVATANPLPVVQTGTPALATGAATSANQSTEITALGSLLTELQLKADLTETQPISAASLPLPSGASTAAKQPALGTAGTASADVITVQGITSMTALKVDGSAVTQPVSGTVAVTGVSTAANQATEIASLASIDGKITAVNTGAVVISSGHVNVDAQTGNGNSMFRNTALSNTAVAVKASAGNLSGCHIYNPNSSAAFVQFYNVAQGSVTVGTTTPDWTIFVPALGGVDGDILPTSFTTAITVAATTTITGGTAPSTGLLVNLRYK